MVIFQVKRDKIRQKYAKNIEMTERMAALCFSSHPFTPQPGAAVHAFYPQSAEFLLNVACPVSEPWIIESL